MEQWSILLGHDIHMQVLLHDGAYELLVKSLLPLVYKSSDLFLPCLVHNGIRIWNVENAAV